MGEEGGGAMDRDALSNPAYTYPLVLMIRDDYDPRVARWVVEAVGALDDASCRVTVRLAVTQAVRDVNNERN
jgi:hypothetical protein